MMMKLESRGGLEADAFPPLQMSFHSSSLEMDRTHHPRDWLEDTCSFQVGSFIAVFR